MKRYNNPHILAAQIRACSGSRQITHEDVNTVHDYQGIEVTEAELAQLIALPSVTYGFTSTEDAKNIIKTAYP